MTYIVRTHRQKSVARIIRTDYGINWRAQSDTVKLRDKHTCQKCGRRKTDLKVGECLEVHHIVPLSRGGTNSRLNLHTLCSTCHKKEHRHL